MALGEIARAQTLIDAVPDRHAFEIRYTEVENADWESCAEVLSDAEKRRVLQQSWG